jgi:hypothetical protein
MPSGWRLHINDLTQINKRGFYPRAILHKRSHDNAEPPTRLIDVRSTTFNVVSRLVSSLESPEHIIIMNTAQMLEVSLPRLRLSFFVNTDGELECRSIPGFIIDQSQSCGTLFGLRNKLVLCPTHTISKSEGPSRPNLSSRRVIIPQGDISFRTTGDFADVLINTDTQKHVRWHDYRIDVDLGCLTSNQSLESRLYQCYLHALTSHCLPDPLLGSTGTEEALQLLRSAACRSFQRLDIHEVNLLQSIRDLSPHREFSRQSTIKTKWNDLPALAQHHDFALIACSLLDQAYALEAFFGLPANLQHASDHDQSLSNWTTFHHRSYYPSDLHISEPQLLPLVDDVEYWSKDVPGVAIVEDVFFRELAAPQHMFLPQSITSHPELEASFNSPHDKSTSQFNDSNLSLREEPSHHQSYVSHTAAEGIPLPASSERLKILIEELLDSPKPLIQLYGDELNKSHRALLRQANHRRTGCVIPSHEVLLLYHEECSRRKDKLFSKISAALLPSETVEEISHIAGLWPRITPRSILRQLAHDRINTLPEKWKALIIKYAIFFVRYQRSLRLLDLLSRQKYEEVLREMEGIRHDVLAGSKPDWLLIQVRCTPF